MSIDGGLGVVVVVVLDAVAILGKLIRLFTGVAIEGTKLKPVEGSGMGTWELDDVGGGGGERVTLRSLC